MAEISVCIPAYEAPEYLGAAVESVLSQDFEDFELVVTDDSESDAVAELLAGVDDPRLLYVRNGRRLGSPANWVAAVERSTAPLVKLLHHDDRLIRPDSLRRFVRLLDDPRVDLGFSASLVVDEAQRPLREHRPLDEIEALRGNPRRLLLGNWIGAPSATIYRRSSSATIDSGLRWVVDIDLYLSVLVANPRFAYDREALVSTTFGAAHQVTNEVEGDANAALHEWFTVAAKWAPPALQRRELLRHLAALQRRYGARDWRDYRRLGLHGRAARLFVAARLTGAGGDG